MTVDRGPHKYIISNLHLIARQGDENQEGLPCLMQGLIRIDNLLCREMLNQTLPDPAGIGMLRHPFFRGIRR